MKCFLFDIGHVLVDFNTEDFFREASSDADRPVEPLTELDAEMIAEVENGQVNDAEFVEYLNKAKGLSWTVDDLIALWARIFSINEAGRNLFLEIIKAGVPVYILSNIAQHHIDAIERNWSGFFAGAAGFFLSYQMGLRKPDPAIYRYVLDALGVEGRECFFIDDRIENVDAAREAGIHAHHFIPENHAVIKMAARDFFEG